MSEMEIKNAVIKSVRFCKERGFTLWIDLDYGGSGQGFGGWLLYSQAGWEKNGGNANVCGHYLARVFDVCGVSDLAKVVGKSVRVKATNCKVHAIGHIIKDDWFDPEIEFRPWVKGITIR